MNKVTIRDVAIRAGVSPTTVSRVTNNKVEGYMQKATKDKVLRAIQELKYTPDLRARSLRGLRSGIIGLVVPHGLNPFYQELAYALTKIFYKEGYGLLLCNSENDIEKELFYIEFLASQNVDGIIISTEHLSGDKVNTLLRGTPIVLIDEDIPDANAPAIFANNYQGACLATQYLINSGHKRIAFLKGPDLALSCRDRWRGYCDTLRKNGLTVNYDFVGKGNLSYKSGYKAMKQFLRSHNGEFTAIFCSNDFMALGVMRAIQDAGRKIPHDYSVIGFDNTYVSSLTNPQLTTVAQPIAKIGREAFKIIKNWDKSPLKIKSKHKYLDTKLVIRESCAENTPG